MKKGRIAALVTAAVLLVSGAAAAEDEAAKILLGGTEIEIEEDDGNFQQAPDGSPAAPEWADVTLNARGFVDGGACHVTPQNERFVSSRHLFYNVDPLLSLCSSDNRYHR